MFFHLPLYLHFLVNYLTLTAGFSKADRNKTPSIILSTLEGCKFCRLIYNIQLISLPKTGVVRILITFSPKLSSFWSFDPCLKVTPKLLVLWITSRSWTAWPWCWPCWHTAWGLWPRPWGLLWTRPCRPRLLGSRPSEDVHPVLQGSRAAGKWNQEITIWVC